MSHFHHVILGTGQALGTLLGSLLPTGDSIAVIEGDRIGGTCVNTGCTPTKALVATSRSKSSPSRTPEFSGFPVLWITRFAAHATQGDAAPGLYPGNLCAGHTG